MPKCEDCDHTWHGLACEHKNSRFDENYTYTVTEKCKCPTSYKEN